MVHGWYQPSRSRRRRRRRRRAHVGFRRHRRHRRANGGRRGAGVECIVARAWRSRARARARSSPALYLLFNKLAPALASRPAEAPTPEVERWRRESSPPTDGDVVAISSTPNERGDGRGGGGAWVRARRPRDRRGRDRGAADLEETGPRRTTTASPTSTSRGAKPPRTIFEMESEEPPPFTDQPEEDADLGVGLGVSLRAELQSQLERRRAKLGDLRAQKSAGKNVPDATVARVEADVEALRREIKAFEDGGFAYSKNASSRLVSRNASEIRRARRSHREGSASGGYLDVAGEWREVSEAAAAVTRLDVELEKMSSRAAVTGKPVDAAEMNELREQRAVWGLRLVSAQIKGIVGIRSAMIEGPADASADALGENIRRLQELTAEKSALLEKLSETERKGAEASGAAEKLRAEVAELKVRLEGYKTLEGKRARWDSDRAELEKKLRDAEAAKFRLKMQSENETSKLYAEAKRLKERLAEKERALAEASALASEAANVAPLEAEVADLKAEISTLRYEMAEKDRAAGEATAMLRAQLEETSEALRDSEARLEDAKKREETLSAGAADEEAKTKASGGGGGRREGNGTSRRQTGRRPLETRGARKVRARRRVRCRGAFAKRASRGVPRASGGERASARLGD